MRDHRSHDTATAAELERLGHDYGPDPAGPQECDLLPDTANPRARSGARKVTKRVWEVTRTPEQQRTLDVLGVDREAVVAGLELASAAVQARVGDFVYRVRMDGTSRVIG